MLLCKLKRRNLIMKIRTLLMGSAAAALIAVGVNTTTIIATTEAADVRTCDRYGSGFYFIPGTETCIKMSGRVRGHYESGSTETTVTNPTGATTANEAQIRALTATAAGAATDDDPNGTPAVTAVDRRIAARASLAAVSDSEADNGEFVTNARIQFDLRNRSDVGTVRSVARFSGNGAGGTSWDALRIHVGEHITFGTFDSFFTRHNGYGHPVANFDGPYPFYSPDAYFEFTGSAGPIDFTVGTEDGVDNDELNFYAGAKYTADGIGDIAVHYLSEADVEGASEEGDATLGVAVNINAVDNLALKAWYTADDDGTGRIIGGPDGSNNVIAFGASYSFGDWSIGAGYGITSGADAIVINTANTAVNTTPVEPEQTDLTVELGWNIAPGLKAELAWQSVETTSSIDLEDHADAFTGTVPTGNSKGISEFSEVRLRIVRNW